MFAGFDAFTWFHTILSIVALIAGAIAVKGLLESRVTPIWTEIYLISAVLTSATGFGFPGSFTPAKVVGTICLILLAVALLALYAFKLRGSWRWLYARSASWSVPISITSCWSRSSSPRFRR